MHIAAAKAAAVRKFLTMTSPPYQKFFQPNQTIRPAQWRGPYALTQLSTGNSRYS